MKYLYKVLGPDDEYVTRYTDLQIALDVAEILLTKYEAACISIERETNSPGKYIKEYDF